MKVVNLNDKTKFGEMADVICNHFLNNCNATVSRIDYDFVKNEILYFMMNLEHTKIKPINLG